MPAQTELGAAPFLPELRMKANLEKSLEARGGIEPPNRGFADLCLTTWLPRLAMGETMRCYREQSIRAMMVYPVFL